MTTEWILFSFVMPGVILAIGLIGAYSFVRGLDREDERARRRDPPPKT